jgi:hypothetical protein
MVPTHVKAEIPWWREPTRDQWLAWVAGRLGWTLDAFDFTIAVQPIGSVANVHAHTRWRLRGGGMDISTQA